MKMAIYQVTCSELVYVDRTYEIEADSKETAERLIKESQGSDYELVEEQMQDSYKFCGVKSVDEV